MSKKEIDMKLLTASRAKYVEGFLTNDPVFKSSIKGNKDTPLKGKNGSTVNFNANLVEVVKAIISGGADPYSVRKADVLKVAKKVIKLPEAAGPDTELLQPPVEATAEIPGPDVTKSVAAAAPVVDEWNPQGVPGVTPVIAIVSLGLSMLQQAEFDHSEGYAERKKELDVIVTKYIGLITRKPTKKS